MTNQDIKFIPSGKDSKACTFYMTDFVTKWSLSTHQMLPLIVASVKKMDATTAITENSAERSKKMITKCLNRITTETEISGSHVCHFLLGFSDKKTPDTFCALNLHSFLEWAAGQVDEMSDDDLLKTNAIHCRKAMMINLLKTNAIHCRKETMDWF